jgi:hypothetical protein
VLAVAQGRIPAVLAPAEIGSRIQFRRESHGVEFRALMAPIAERLAFALATRAPLIGLTLFGNNRHHVLLYNLPLDRHGSFFLSTKMMV